MTAGGQLMMTALALEHEWTLATMTVDSALWLDVDDRP